MQNTDNQKIMILQLESIIRDYDEYLFNMSATINLYSDELAPTIEHKSLFKALTKDYHGLKKLSNIIKNILKAK
jgi:hypothetical protein